MADLENLIRNVISFKRAALYSPQKLSELGLDLLVNTSYQKTRFIGSQDKPVYPQIIIWNKLSNKAVLTEFIETKNSVFGSMFDWKKAYDLNLILNITVPMEKVDQAKSNLNLMKIKPTHLYVYYFTGENVSEIEEIKL